LDAERPVVERKQQLVLLGDVDLHEHAERLSSTLKVADLMGTSPETAVAETLECTLNLLVQRLLAPVVVSVGVRHVHVALVQEREDVPILALLVDLEDLAEELELLQ